MSTYPRIAFVDAPSLAATIRLGLTEGIGRITKTEFTLGAPSLSGSPGQTGVEWGPRDLKLRCRIRGTRSEALSLLQQIAREVVRAENWLLVQLDPEDIPVWYRTYRTQPGELDLSNVVVRPGQVDDGLGQWAISIPLSADPFAYGEEITLGPFTINNDPAAGSNPCRLVLPAIKGDAAAPVSVEIKPSTNWASGSCFFALASGHREMPFIVWQAEDFFLGNDTTEVADVTCSDGKKAAISPIGTPMLTRIYGLAPSTPPPGRYKVLARVLRTSEDTDLRLWLFQIVNGKTIPARSQGVYAAGTVTEDALAALVDLGEFNFPFGATALDSQTLASAAPTISVSMGRQAGTGTAAIDYLVLIPIELPDMTGTRSLLSLFAQAAITSSHTVIWDSTREVLRVEDSSGNLTDAAATMVGGFPQVEPGATNVLHLHQGMSEQSNFEDVIAASAVVRFRYHPQYLNLAGDD